MTAAFDRYVPVIPDSERNRWSGASSSSPVRSSRSSQSSYSKYYYDNYDASPSSLSSSYWRQSFSSSSNSIRSNSRSSSRSQHTSRQSTKRNYEHKRTSINRHEDHVKKLSKTASPRKYRALDDNNKKKQRKEEKEEKVMKSSKEDDTRTKAQIIGGDDERKECDEIKDQQEVMDDQLPLVLGQRIYKNKYIIKSLLGNGACCAVFGAQNTNSSDAVALKIFYPSMQHLAESEIKMLYLLNHAWPHQTLWLTCIEDFKFTVEPSSVSTASSSSSSSSSPSPGQDFTVICTPLAGTCLFKLRNQVSRITLEFTRKVILQVVLAIDAIHKAKCVHRDIRLDNILLRNTAPIIGNRFPAGHEVILADFGSAFHLTEENMVNGVNMKGQFNAPAANIRPPEFLTGFLVYQASDIWAIGCTAYELFVGEFLFDYESDERREQINGVEIITGQKVCGVFEVETEDSVTPVASLTTKASKSSSSKTLEEKLGHEPQLSAFVRRCLQVDHRQRPTTTELLDDPFLAPLLKGRDGTYYSARLNG